MIILRVLFVSLAAAVTHLDKYSDLSALIDQSRVNLILYKDSLTDDLEEWSERFRYVEASVSRERFWFFDVDARKFPQFEDERMSFAINHQRTSAADNYVLALTEGRIRKIDWNA